MGTLGMWDCTGCTFERKWCLQQGSTQHRGGSPTGELPALATLGWSEAEAVARAAWVALLSAAWVALLSAAWWRY